MNKKKQRKKYIDIRNLLNKDYIDKASINIAKNIANTKEYKNSKNIFVFISKENEINTKYIIEKSINDKKDIYAPVVLEKKREMEFRKFEKYSKLKKSKFNILEPINAKPFLSDNNTLIIVPALVYDKRGYRLGYGGGYYDYFLQNNKCLCSIGVILHMFLLDEIAIEKYDEKVDIIVTEKEVYNT